MFTVILLSDRAKLHFHRWSALFDPFLEENQIAFCEWHHGASVSLLSHAVPDLIEAIRGKIEWRALVIDAGTSFQSSASETQPDNPFDFLDNCVEDPKTGEARDGLALAESPHQIVRLCHMLLGYPDLGAKAFIPDSSFWSSETHRRVYHSDFMAQRDAEGHDPQVSEALFRAKLVTESDVRVDYQEVAYTEEEKQHYRLLARRYRAHHTLPMDVVLLATRDPVAANPSADVLRAWGREYEQGTSRFVARNDYPASCRFAVYDMHSQEHAEFEINDLKFWLTVLTMATNDLTPSSFQAERLYRVGIDMDDGTLTAVLNDHLGHLMAVRENLDAHIRSAAPPTEIDLNEVLRQRQVEVVFDKMGGDDLSVSTSGYSLSSDVPRSDSARWVNSYAELTQRAENFIRKPRRILSRAVFDVRNQLHAYPKDDRLLGDIERDELQEELTKRIKRLTEPTTARILDRERLRETLRSQDQVIRLAIQGRMRLRTITTALSVVILVWFATFVPFLVQAGFIGAENFGYSLVVVFVTLLAVTLVVLAALMLVRWKLIRLLKDLNAQLLKFVREVNAGAGEFAAFLSDLVTYMYGRHVLDVASRGESQHELDSLRLAAWSKRISERVESEMAIIRATGYPVVVKRIQVEPTSYHAKDFNEFRAIFRLNTGIRLALLNESGETIKAPYDFVTRLRVEFVVLPERLTIGQQASPPSDRSSGEVV